MDEKLVVQMDNFRNLVRARQNYKKSPKTRITETYAQVRLEFLEQLWETFMKEHKSVLESYGLELSEHEYFKAGVYEQAEDLYIEYKTDLKDVIKLYANEKECKSRLIVEPKTDTQGVAHIKLPKIVIPKFSGQYTEWITFRDLFVSLIHNNTSLDGVQKIHYLKGYLVGEAEQLLRQIPISEANYEKCWDLLKTRYNNKKYLSHCILKRLLSQKNAVTESARNLKDLIDTSTDCLNALQNLGIDVSNWDIIVIHILTLKLDAESKKQWELFATSNQASDTLPTFVQFSEFITNRFRALEYIEQKPNKPQQSFMITNNLRSMHIASPEQRPQQCPMCAENHKLQFCEKFSSLDSDTRRDIALKNRICFNCLGANHSVRFCKSSLKCRICRRSHHTLLHPKTANKENITTAMVTEEDSDDAEDPVEEIQTNTAAVKNNSVLLATALVKAESRNGDYYTVRALLDQGSQASFISESTVQLLRLQKIPNQGIISGVGGGKTVKSKSVVQLKLKSFVEPEIEISVKAHVLKSITSFLPGKEIGEMEWLNLAEVKLADPHYHKPNKIDVLLGAEVYSQVLNDGIVKDPTGLLVAQATAFGWIISGLVNSITEEKIVVMHAAIDINYENDILKKFWEMESENTYEESKMLTEEEKRCEEFYEKTTERDSDGRFVVKLPFRYENVTCRIGNTKQIAMRRLLALEKRMLKNEVLKAEYDKIFKEYLMLKFMEPVKKDETEADSVYLPYHEVIRADKDTTKVRIVMNASSKGAKGESLNENLMVGPKLQMDLRHILMRWRKHPVVLVADIEKMYHQIKLSEEDTNFQRILWRSSPETEITDYKMVRVLFGTACAPHLAVRSLMQVAADEGHQFPRAAKRVVEDFYMDDLLTGCESASEGVEIYKEMKEMLKKAGFQLKKWSSNSAELLEGIMEGKKEDIMHKTLEIKTDSVIKILGLTWNRQNDSYSYVVKLQDQEKPVTKRKIIADIARLFDPLGWVAPVVITAKIIIQKLWLAGVDWDEEVPERLLKEWFDYYKDLKLLEQVNIPRYLGFIVDDDQVELHGFSDASQVAYAAVVYIRHVSANNEVQISLTAAKTKVAPVKQVSVPRLELCGAVLLTKLLAEVGAVLEIPKCRWFAWTDSTVVLAWLNSHPSRWKTFIANRVSTIIGTLDPQQWNHVSTKSNPADLASRGIKPAELLKSSLWLKGPEMLKPNIIKTEKPKGLDTHLEEATKKIYAHVVHEETSLLDKYSSFAKLIRVVAYCRRFLNLLKPSIDRHRSVILTKVELEEATENCIKQCQSNFFFEEIKDLTSKKNLKRNSKLLTLNPFLDDKHVLRVGGRLEHAQLSDDQKHPILIPKEGSFTRLLIDYAHKNTLHGGPQLMLSFLLSKYWVLGAKQLVKGYVRRCIICVKNAAMVTNQLMGQLPPARVTPGRAFKKSGVDYAGPINIRSSKGRGHCSYKGYICLFVCMVTRAVHIEAVSDLTATGFLSAFKRFVARRGHCSDLYSDNGSNFVGAARELKILLDTEQSTVGKEIAESLATNGTAWHFIPPRAPNFGGLWEAGIKSTKFHLKRVIGNTTLTYEELSTVLAQIESCLNSRPLCRIEGEYNSETVLTPGHFLIGESLITVPDRNFEAVNVSSLRRWQLTQRMLQDFWRRWSHDYIQSLQQRYKWKDQTAIEPKIGDVVLIKEDDLPPCRWLLGKIVTKHPDHHNITRVVTLRTKGTLMKRAMSKLVVLPIET